MKRGKGRIKRFHNKGMAIVLKIAGGFGGIKQNVTAERF